MDKPIGRCGKCGTLFESIMIDKPCPWCDNPSIEYISGKNSCIDYFQANIPKLNNPLDFAFPNKVVKPIFNKNELDSIHYLNVIAITCKESQYIIKLALTWDNNFKTVYAIYEDINNLGNFYINDISLENLNNMNNDTNCTMFRIPLPKKAYEKFNSLLRDGNNSLSLSNYFQTYNSIKWDILDPFGVEQSIHKTFYEYASINYLLHLFQLMKLPELFEDFEEKLISFSQLSNHELFSNYYIYNNIPLNEFMNKISFKDYKKEYLNESHNFLKTNNIYDFEDVFDYFMQEGAVAPNAVPLSPVIMKSTAVYNKLYDLGYNPSMNLYSNDNKTLLCPTIQRNNSFYYLECNNNLMKGINEVDSEIQIKEILDELFDNKGKSIFISIKNIPSDIMQYNVINAKNNDDFLKRLLDIKDNYNRPNYDFEENIYDQIDADKSILNKFRKIEMNQSSLFRYGHTFYKLKAVQWSGTKSGYMYLDENNNIVGYIISDVVQNDYNIYKDISKEIINEITTIEVISEYKNTDLDIEMIISLAKEKSLDTIRIRDFRLLNKLETDNRFYLIGNEKGTRIFAINNFNKMPLNESIILNESNTINPTKRKKIEDLIYSVFDKLDTTGANTKKYKELYNSMSNEKFNLYMKEFLNDPKRNFYLECLPNKNAPKIKNAVDALNILKVPTEEYLYYRHDGHKDDPIRTMYKVPILYINVRRLQQILSKKNTFSLDINKRNLKTGQLTADDKIA